MQVPGRLPLKKQMINGNLIKVLGKVTPHESLLNLKTISILIKQIKFESLLTRIILELSPHLGYFKVLNTLKTYLKTQSSQTASY